VKGRSWKKTCSVFGVVEEEVFKTNGETTCSGNLPSNSLHRTKRGEKGVKGRPGDKKGDQKNRMPQKKSETSL